MHENVFNGVPSNIRYIFFLFVVFGGGGGVRFILSFLWFTGCVIKMNDANIVFECGILQLLFSIRYIT